jgi:hypothetical protein
MPAERDGTCSSSGPDVQMAPATAGRLTNTNDEGDTECMPRRSRNRILGKRFKFEQDRRQEALRDLSEQLASERVAVRSNRGDDRTSPNGRPPVGEPTV